MEENKCNECDGRGYNWINMWFHEPPDMLTCEICKGKGIINKRKRK